MLTYGATNLPGGVSISASTGLISGTIGGGSTATAPGGAGERTADSNRTVAVRRHEGGGPTARRNKRLSHFLS
jgi:hypothetical protein